MQPLLVPHVQPARAPLPEAACCGQSPRHLLCPGPVRHAQPQWPAAAAQAQHRCQSRARLRAQRNCLGMCLCARSTATTDTNNVNRELGDQICGTFVNKRTELARGDIEAGVPSIVTCMMHHNIVTLVQVELIHLVCSVSKHGSVEHECMCIQLQAYTNGITYTCVGLIDDVFTEAPGVPALA